MLQDFAENDMKMREIILRGLRLPWMCQLN